MDAGYLVRVGYIDLVTMTPQQLRYPARLTSRLYRDATTLKLGKLRAAIDSPHADATPLLFDFALSVQQANVAGSIPA
jgi:hypothetical protein